MISIRSLNRRSATSCHPRQFWAAPVVLFGYEDMDALVSGQGTSVVIKLAADWGGLNPERMITSGRCRQRLALT